MKQLILIVTLALSINAYAQDDKTVTLVASGQGKTQDEAKQVALRSAIEQAFGTFISSKTEILNDNLVKDEIVSVTNGNIQKFDVLSELQLPDGSYATTLKAIVSVTKLTSFCESKGVEVEFKGALFAFNINQQMLNELNEQKLIGNMKSIVNSISKNAFNYEIKTDQPLSISGSNDEWNVPVTIDVTVNKNFVNIPKIIFSTLKGCALSQTEAETYIKLNKKIYAVTIAMNKNNYIRCYLRSAKSVDILIDLIYSFSKDIMNFQVENGIDTLNPIQINHLNSQYNGIAVYDCAFRFFLKGGLPASLFDNLYKHYLSDIQCPKRLYHPEFNSETIASEGRSYSQKEIFEWRNRGGVPPTAYDYHLISLPGQKGSPFDNKSKFYFLNSLIEKNVRETIFGLTISFIDIKENDIVISLKYNDKRKLNDLKKITSYKLIK